MPCQFCLVFYLKTDMWRHVQKCDFRQHPLGTDNQKVTKDLLKASKMLLAGALSVGPPGTTQISNEMFVEHIISRFTNDDITRTVKSDHLLLSLGTVLFEKLGTERANEVRSRMRNGARLKMKLQEITNRNVALEDFITGTNFDNCITAVKDLAEISTEHSLNGVIMFKKPSLALKLGSLLKKVAGLKRGKAIRAAAVNRYDQRSQEKRKEADDFITLFDTEWTDAVASSAHQSASERRFNKKDLLPVTKDLVKLKAYHSTMIPKCIVALEEEPIMTNWQNLARVVLSSLILFNKRRGEEPAKMLLKKYEDRADWRQANEELTESLKPVEKILMKK